MRLPKTRIPLAGASAKRLTADQAAVTISCLFEDDAPKEFIIYEGSKILEEAGQQWQEFSFGEKGEEEQPYMAAVFWRDGCVTSLFHLRTPKGSEFLLGTDAGNPAISIEDDHKRKLGKLLLEIDKANRPSWENFPIPDDVCPVCWKSGGRHLAKGCCLCTGDVKPDQKETVREFAQSFKTPRIVVGKTLLIELTPGVGDWTAFAPHIFNKGQSPSGITFPDGIGEHGRIGQIPDEQAEALAAKCQRYYDDLRSIWDVRPGSSILVAKPKTAQAVIESSGPLKFGEPVEKSKRGRKRS